MQRRHLIFLLNHVDDLSLWTQLSASLNLTKLLEVLFTRWRNFQMTWWVFGHFWMNEKFCIEGVRHAYCRRKSRGAQTQNLTSCFNSHLYLSIGFRAGWMWSLQRLMILHENISTVNMLTHYSPHARVIDWYPHPRIIQRQYIQINIHRANVLSYFVVVAH